MYRTAAVRGYSQVTKPQTDSVQHHSQQVHLQHGQASGSTTQYLICTQLPALQVEPSVEMEETDNRSGCVVASPASPSACGVAADTAARYFATAPECCPTLNRAAPSSFNRLPRFNAVSTASILSMSSLECTADKHCLWPCLFILGSHGNMLLLL